MSADRVPAPAGRPSWCEPHPRQLDDHRERDHWAFYPRFSPDGSQIYYDYDPKDPYNSYRVDLAIFASPADPSSARAVQWTYPNEYTGGDVNPVPLRGGGLIFTRFSIDDQSNVHSQIWYQARPGSQGTPLTDPADDCLQPAVSADERQLGMVCTQGQPQVGGAHDCELLIGRPSGLGPTDGAGQRAARGVAVICARRQDDRLPCARHTRRRLPALDRQRRPVNGGNAHGRSRPRSTWTRQSADGLDQLEARPKAVDGSSAPMRPISGS